MPAITSITIPFTITGGLSTTNNSGVNTLSGYTCALTKFIFTVPTTAAFTLSAISNDVFLWDLGDGTIVRSATATHIYPFPGIYTVSLFVYNSAGVEFRSTVTKQLSVANFLSDSLRHVPSHNISVLNIYAGAKGDTLPEINLERHNSWQSYNALSATGYTISLYASGSLSKKHNNTSTSNTKWAHIDQTWSFYSKTTADNLSVEYVPIDETTTADEKIFYVNRVVNGSPEIIKVDEDDLSLYSNTVFVGTSGSSTVYFADDTPKLNNSPIFIYAFTDTAKFPDQQQIINNSLASQDVLKYFEHRGVVIPAYIKYNPSNDLTFSSNALPKMPLTNTKWQNTQIPFFINLRDINGNFVENYPSLSARAATRNSSPSSNTYVVNLSVTNTSSTQLLSASFFRENDSQLPISLDGMFRGYLVPHQIQDQAKLIGEVKINDIPHFPKDNYFHWYINSDKQKLYKNSAYTEYTSSPTTGLVTSTKNISISSIGINNQTEFGSYYPWIAVIPTSDDINRNEIKAYISSTLADKISSYNSSYNLESVVNLRNILYDSTNQPENVPATFSTTNNNVNGYPTSITANERREIWASLSGSCVVVEISTQDTLANVYTPANTRYNTTTTLGNGRIAAIPNTAGIYNLIEPTIVEASSDSNIWVAYTNPISSFVEKINSTSISPITSYSLPQGYITKDMVGDNSNNIWIASTDTLRTIQNKSVTIIGSMSSRESNNSIIYKVITQSISAFTTDQLVSFNGFTNNFYNGTFIIRAVNTSIGEITVTPYQGRLNQIILDQTITPNVTAIRYLSDRVYKIDSNGSKVFELSGLLSPEFIVVDEDQTAWVLHDVNTLTHVSSIGSILQNIAIESRNFVNQFVSAGSTLSASTSSNDIHFGGLSCDTVGNVLVLDSFENKLFYIPTSTPSLSASYILDTALSPTWPSTSFLHGKYKAKGDWTGFRWLNKYLNTTGIRTITGETTFNIYPSGGKYKIAKINENFDPSETLKSYRYQPAMFEYESFFNDFLGTIVGTLSSDPSHLGKRVYEKIANFTDNHVDIDTCDINAVYSLCHQLDVDANNYNFAYPSNLLRVMDMLSISRSKLIGQRNKFNRDFNTRASTNADYGINLGSRLNVRTAIITAGNPIVSRQLFTGQFKLIPTMYVSGVSSAPGYVTKYNLLSSYPLSGYTSSWGWGLEQDVTGIDIENHYNFYTYKSTYNNIQLEGVIDWNNSYNTVTESMSSINDWIKDNGIIDTAIEYEIRKGLNLFVTPVTSINTNIL